MTEKVDGGWILRKFNSGFGKFVPIVPTVLVFHFVIKKKNPLSLRARREGTERNTPRGMGYVCVASRYPYHIT